MTLPTILFDSEPCTHCEGKGKIQRVRGSSLKARRLACGVGLRELARRMDLSPTQLCDIEAGRRSCSQVVENAYRDLKEEGDGQVAT